MQLREASKQQSKIGWIKVLKGSLSTRWQDYVTAHLKATKSRLKAENGQQSSFQLYGKIHYGYGNTGMMPSTLIMTFRQNDTN
jgi:hypothetical protein